MAFRPVLHFSVQAYLEEFQASLHTHLADLRNSLRSVEDGSYEQRMPVAPAGSVVSLVIEPPPTGPEAKARHCGRCLQDLIRTLATFLDRLIALKRCAMQPVQAPTDLPDEKAILAFGRSWFDEQYSSVSTDRGLTTPKKLAELPELEPAVKQSLRALFDVRNCLEHHGGVARTPLNLPFFTAALSHKDQPVAALPLQVEEGDLMKLEYSKQVRSFEVNSRIELTEAEVEGVAMYLSVFAGPVLVEALRRTLVRAATDRST